MKRTTAFFFCMLSIAQYGHTAGIIDSYIPADRFIQNQATELKSGYTTEKYIDFQNRWLITPHYLDRTMGVYFTKSSHGRLFTRTYEENGLTVEEHVVNDRTQEKLTYDGYRLVKAEYFDDQSRSKGIKVLMVKGDLSVHRLGDPYNAEYPPALVIQSNRQLTNGDIKQINKRFSSEVYFPIVVKVYENGHIVRAYSSTKDNAPLRLTQTYYYDGILRRPGEMEITDGDYRELYVYRGPLLIQHLEYQTNEHNVDYKDVRWDSSGKVILYEIKQAGKRIRYLHQYTDRSLVVTKMDGTKKIEVYREYISDTLNGSP